MMSHSTEDGTRFSVKPPEGKTMEVVSAIRRDDFSKSEVWVTLRFFPETGVTEDGKGDAAALESALDELRTTAGLFASSAALTNAECGSLLAEVGRLSELVVPATKLVHEYELWSEDANDGEFALWSKDRLLEAIYEIRAALAALREDT